MGRIFISHSTKDGAGVSLELVRALEAAGRGCWIAPRDVRAGAPYPGQIVAAIRECAALVLVVTPGANESHDVLQEVQQAAALKKTILPIMVGAVRASDDLAYFISVRHQVPWTAAGDAADAVLQGLGEPLARPLGSRPLSAAAPPRPVSPPTSQRTVQEGGSAPQPGWRKAPSPQPPSPTERAIREPSAAARPAREPPGMFESPKAKTDPAASTAARSTGARNRRIAIPRRTPLQGEVKSKAGYWTPSWRHRAGSWTVCQPSPSPLVYLWHDRSTRIEVAGGPDPWIALNMGPGMNAIEIDEEGNEKPSLGFLQRPWEHDAFETVEGTLPLKLHLTTGRMFDGRGPRIHIVPPDHSGGPPAVWILAANHTSFLCTESGAVHLMRGKDVLRSY